MSSMKLPVEAASAVKCTRFLPASTDKEQYAVPIGDLANEVIWKLTQKLAERKAGEAQRSPADQGSCP